MVAIMYLFSCKYWTIEPLQTQSGYNGHTVGKKMFYFPSIEIKRKFLGKLPRRLDPPPSLINQEDSDIFESENILTLEDPLGQTS